MGSLSRVVARTGAWSVTRCIRSTRAVSARYSVWIELWGSLSGCWSLAAHPATGAMDADHLDGYERPWGACGAAPNVRGGKRENDGRPLAGRAGSSVLGRNGSYEHHLWLYMIALRLDRVLVKQE